MAELSPWGHALAGALGGVLSNGVVYPLDTVKTKIQADSTSSSSSSDSSNEASTLPEPVLKRNAAPRRLPINISNKPGVLKVISTILHEQGIEGFYRGFNASMLNTFAVQFAYFYWQTIVRDTYMDKIRPALYNGLVQGPLNTATELFLGAVAGALAQLFTTPVSVVATRQQLEETKHSQSAWQTTRDILKQDGITGLWRGLKPSLVLTVNPAITYGMFERLKVVFLGEKGKMTPGKAFLIGALSKAMATVVTYPYIFAKVRLQAKNKEASSKDANSGSNEGEQGPSTEKEGQEYDGALGVLRKVREEKGVLGWYQGMRSQILKAVLAQALLFGAKEELEQFTLRLMLAFSALKIARRS